MKNNLLEAIERGGVTEYRSADSPFVCEFFLVQGDYYRCMAYRDNNGKWRAAFNHFELPGLVQILL